MASGSGPYGPTDAPSWGRTLTVLWLHQRALERREPAISAGHAIRRRGADRHRAPVPYTKTRPPTPPPTLVSRERLERRITAAGCHDAGERAVLVCAGPGAGKTSLLSAFAATLERAAWVTLDRHDNDPHILWSAILDALTRSNAWPEDTDLRRLAAPDDGIEPGFLSAVVNAFEPLTAPVWLILDDLHMLQRPVALDSLDQLIRYLPDNLRLVLSARHDPPLAGLDRLRLAGRLNEIRADDLAFNQEETRQLLAGHGLELADADIYALLERTEGWAAGLRLAVLSASQTSDTHAFFAHFQGSDRAVADYLVESILTQLPGSIRRFLLRTSICAELTPALATILTGRTDAGMVLDELARLNALTVRIGQPTGWYRYHALLRSYLRAELELTEPTEIASLHGRAADWFAKAGRHELALEHAMASGNVTTITALCDAHGLGLLLSGHGTRLRDLCASAQDELLAQPELGLIAASAALDAGDVANADRYLAHVGAGELGPRLEVFRDAVALWRARLGGDMRVPLDALVDNSKGGTGDDDVDLVVLVNRGAARVWLKQTDEAEADLNRALELSRRLGRDELTLQCLNFLAGVASARCDFARVRTLAQQALDFGATRGWGRTSRAAYAHTGLAWAAYQAADLAAAGDHIRSARDCRGDAAEVNLELTILSLLHMIEFSEGADRHRALAAFRASWRRLAGPDLSPLLVAFAAPNELRMSLALGELGWAAEAIKRTATLLGDTGERALLSADLSNAKGHLEAARTTLRPIIDGDLACTVTTTLVDALLLDARLAARAGHAAGAHDRLERALELAEPCEALRPFAVAGDAVRELLVLNSGRYGRREAFAQRILRRCRPDAAVLDGRVVRLTPAELRVLAELPTLSTLQQIADAQYLSVNTVKTHLRGIYHKLAVHSRRDAVAQARLVGLL